MVNKNGRFISIPSNKYRLDIKLAFDLKKLFILVKRYALFINA